MAFILQNKDGLYYSINKKLTLDKSKAYRYKFFAQANDAILDMHDMSDDWIILEDKNNFVITPKMFSQLQQINWEVNKLPYKTDLEMYNRPDFWTSRPDKAGDCDDYAAVKRRLCRNKWPGLKEFFKFALCWVEDYERTIEGNIDYSKPLKGQGGYHAVLAIVPSNHKVVILDNRYKDVKPWHQLPYDWDKIGHNGKWNRINDGGKATGILI